MYFVVSSTAKLRDQSEHSGDSENAGRCIHFSSSIFVHTPENSSRSELYTRSECFGLQDKMKRIDHIC